MKHLAWMLALVALAASAQAPPSGTNVTLTWTAPTQNTDGSAITDPITYNLYAATNCTACPCTSPTYASIATGLTGSPNVRQNVAYAVIDYHLTAVVDGIESAPAETCWAYKAPPKTPSAPTGFSAQ